MTEWTVDTLREHMQSQIDDLIVRLDERYSGQQVAVVKAETAAERRFDSINEFRGQLGDQASTFLTRNEYEAKHDALVVRVEELSRLASQSAGRAAGVRLSAGAIVGALSGLAAFITVVIVIANVLTGHH